MGRFQIDEIHRWMRPNHMESNRWLQPGSITAMIRNLPRNPAEARAIYGRNREGNRAPRRRGSDLVGEDVLDLAELFVECGGAGLGGRFGLVVVHLLVPVDEETLRQPDDLENQEGWLA